ncbi:glycosyltransferase family 2 protein [Mucilaginibacter conchicola]|uniref:Glycosyltransferase family 2 protein n=1 Tax=Mucilaginibacter conchicola TaxID=2303333 RepID=A0A372P105_9SPHI|nr:glycosyltransferase family 2 protein [Mucilaginibacter conchicola]RFZ95599.1 glycosyltransferase family 2 protein [Mucilaginibacter conchicola]
MPVDISIIIPCFNRVALLRQTLKSVEAAIGGLNAEVILVDDGSDRPISEQITDFAHLPLVISRQKNAGLTTARYNGLLMAKGEYIQFLDSDDQVAANKFDVQLKQMRAVDADVSYTDIAECFIANETGKLTTKHISQIRRVEEAPLFYIKVQPAPHSPIFKREYLTSAIAKSFIALSRDYDPIAEVWFYYNLSIHPAKIIKIDEPLTLYIHHNQERITNHWEWQGLSALMLMHQFAQHLPGNHDVYVEKAKNYVAIAAFNTYRGLPYNIDAMLQEAFIDIWRKLGKSKISDLNGGKYFTFLSKIIGPVTTSKLFKKLNRNNYQHTRTVSKAELDAKLKPVLKLIKS